MGLRARENIRTIVNPTDTRRRCSVCRRPLDPEIYGDIRYQCNVCNKIYNHRYRKTEKYTEWCKFYYSQEEVKARRAENNKRYRKTARSRAYEKTELRKLKKTKSNVTARLNRATDPARRAYHGNLLAALNARIATLEAEKAHARNA
jgi:hypothetical protein